MRNFGSGALQLAHVACGRLDGFIELQLSIWDAIGALLLVEEAGGRSGAVLPVAVDGEGAVPRQHAGHLRRAGRCRDTDDVTANGVARRVASNGRVTSPSRNRRRTRTRCRPASTYLRSAALTAATSPLRSRASIFAEFAQVRPRNACATSAPASASSCARAMRRSSSSAFFAVATSCVGEAAIARARNSSPVAALHLREVLRREDRVDDERAVRRRSAPAGTPMPTAYDSPSFSRTRLKIRESRVAAENAIGDDAAPRSPASRR